MYVALAQLRVEAGAVNANCRRAVDAIERAAERGADLVCLPELFTVGYFSFDSYAREAEGLGGPSLSRLSAAAEAEGVAVVAGSVVEDLEASDAAGYSVPAPEGLANTTAVFDESGVLRGVHRSRDLFGYLTADPNDADDEAEALSVELDGVEVGVVPCSRLRDPAPFGRLREAGADLLVVPGAWAYPDVDAWETLPRARAIENRRFVAVVNASDADGRLLGRSSVYHPSGATLAGSGDDPALVVADVDTDDVSDPTGDVRWTV